MGSRKNPRAAGVLLPMSSLPSPYGIGAFGRAAYEFVDFLHGAKQRYWQVLPLGPTGFGDSPYQSFSAYAGNPYYIDLGALIEDGLLTQDEVRSIDWGDPASVDYAALFGHRERLLRIAFSRFSDRPALDAFRRSQGAWLDDYALYASIKAQHGLKPWWQWPKDIMFKQPAAERAARAALKDDIDFHTFVQHLFFSQWLELKAYAGEKGVSIIGDIPIYVAMDSADVWANSHLFTLDDDLQPTVVAGVPPDGFSRTGQLWGNPLYRWDVMARDGYRWWIDRLTFCLTMYDVLRIDHFRGFESYYAVPYGETDAVHGTWLKGPGQAFVGAINRALGKDANIIAEDLGYLTEDVRALLSSSGYPGMKVLQFAFDSREESDYMPHNYPRHTVVYTGTHDNDTARGWLRDAPPADVQLALDYMGLPDARDIHTALVRTALASVADLAIIPIQDYLGLDSDARINTPATLGGHNWRWRLDRRALTPALQAHIGHMTALYGRASR